MGVLLNLLEPPAIAAAVGLALGRTSVGLPQADAWQAFALFVVPLLLVAAGGESLWIGAGLSRGPTPKGNGSGTIRVGVVAAAVALLFTIR